MANPLDFFDRVAIINLPSRPDRLRALGAELRRIGFDIGSTKVSIPPAPEPSDANGFPSRGVLGNFLSHLDIIDSAWRDGLNNVLVLEDDAIFRAQFRTFRVAEVLGSQPWDMCFIGHALDLAPHADGFVRTDTPFKWAHCYAVNRSVMPRLVNYLRETMDRPVGDPAGGKMYIDGAYSLFRQQNPDVISLLSAPCQSSQKGSPSNLAGRRWYDKNSLTRPAVIAARALRDELWRRNWMT
jgi:GR25 family glycosyltransferase involved in LPS biosynthesis